MSACSSWWERTTEAPVWSSRANPGWLADGGATKMGDEVWAVWSGACPPNTADAWALLMPMQEAKVWVMADSPSRSCCELLDDEACRSTRHPTGRSREVSM